MDNKKIETTEKHLKTVSKKLRILYWVFFILLIIDIVVWLVFLTLSVIDLFMPVSLSIQASVFNLISVILIGSIYTLILISFTQLFKDISQGGTPFSDKQSKRLRYISYLLMACFFVDMFVSMNYTTSIFHQEFGLMNKYPNDEGGKIDINPGIAASALVVYSVSVLVDYGTTLQKQSDSII